MADIRPFRGFRYDPQRVTLAEVVTQPYDKITPSREARNIERDGHPAIRFVFTKGLGHRRISKDPESIARILHFL